MGSCNVNQQEGCRAVDCTVQADEATWAANIFLDPTRALRDHTSNMNSATKSTDCGSAMSVV